MPKLASKHVNAELINFVDFTGGLNLARPAEGIAGNEMQVAENFEYAPDTGLLRVRGGIAPVYTFPEAVTDIIPIAGGNAALVRSGDDLHNLTDGVALKIGSVDGGGPVSFEYWGDDKSSVVMAFGAHLHLYDGTTLKMIDTENAPDAASAVYYRAGRIAAAQENNDTIWFSGVGDPEHWTEGNDGDAIKVEIGYKDGCRMSALGSLAGDMLIFKRPVGQPEYGRIYRLTGNYPDWSIIPYSRGASAWNSNTLANVANDLLYLTREGMASMTAVTEYGDFRQGWAGAKINPKLSQNLTERSRLWHIALKGQVWVWDGKNPEIWCYHYQTGEGAWTTLRFPGIVRAVASVQGVTLLGIGNTVYRMSEANPNDVFVVDDALPDEPVEIDVTALWKPRTILRRNQILLKSVMAGYLSTITASAVVKIDTFKLELPLSGQGDRVALDYDIAFLDTDPLVPSNASAVARRRMQIRRWDITPEIIVTNGTFNLSSLGLEIAEV